MSKLSTFLHGVYAGANRKAVFRWLIGTYVALLHGALGVMILQFDLAPRAVERLEMAAARYRHAHLMTKHNEAVGRPVVLLGDSNIWLLGQTPQSVNLGVSGEITEGLLRSMPRYAATVRGAGAVLLMVGINDLWAHRVAGLEERFRRIAAALPENVPLVWSAIVPAEDFRIAKGEIRAANGAIEALCRARPGCIYVDTWGFLAKDGAQIPAYFRRDRVHLSAEGYQRWTDALQTALGAVRRSGAPSRGRNPDP